MSNRKTGTAFERELCEMLGQHGFWAHNLAQNQVGQPFDILAARNGNSYPIDAKVCENDVFKLSRVEDNQYNSMKKWSETGNRDGWFALKVSDGSIYFLSFTTIEILLRVAKSIDLEKIKTFGWTFDTWVKEL